MTYESQQKLIPMLQKCRVQFLVLGFSVAFFPVTALAQNISESEDVREESDESTQQQVSMPDVTESSGVPLQKLSAEQLKEKFNNIDALDSRERLDVRIEQMRREAEGDDPVDMQTVSSEYGSVIRTDKEDEEKKMPTLEEYNVFQGDSVALSGDKKADKNAEQVIEGDPRNKRRDRNTTAPYGGTAYSQ